jgi:hypothetical protein
VYPELFTSWTHSDLKRLPRGEGALNVDYAYIFDNQGRLWAISTPISASFSTYRRAGKRIIRSNETVVDTEEKRDLDISKPVVRA